jgi:hypothetical protein
MWEYDSKELGALLKDTQNPVPMGVALVLGALTADLKTKSIDNFTKLMDRAYGKPTQAVEITGTDNNIPQDPEARKELVKMLEDDLGLPLTVSDFLKTKNLKEKDDGST